jgi:hypothetical protein
MSGRRWAPGIALTFWLVALPAQAQRPIAAAAERWCANPTEPCGVDAPSASVSTPVDASSPPAGKTDKHFPLLLAAFTTAASADLAISMYQIGRGAAREAGFGSKWQNAPVPFALTKSGMAALFAVGLQRMHKDRPKAALILGLSATVMESFLVVRSARISSVK